MQSAYVTLHAREREREREREWGVWMFMLARARTFHVWICNNLLSESVKREGEHHRWEFWKVRDMVVVVFCFFNPASTRVAVPGMVYETDGGLLIQGRFDVCRDPLPFQSVCFQLTFQGRREGESGTETENTYTCLLYTSPSPRDCIVSRMPSSA